MNKVPLRNLISTQKGFAFKSEWYSTKGRPIVKVSNFTDNSIDTVNLVCIPEEIAKNFPDHELKPDDIVIQTVGSWPNNPQSVVGKAIRIPAEASKALLNQNAVKLIPSNRVDKDFLYFVLRSPQFAEYIVGTAQGAANQASITLDAIRDFQVPLPEFYSQQKIGRILRNYDADVENNTRRIQILEEMAQALYREWFVHFRFPGHVRSKMVESEAGPIPEGWQARELRFCASIHKGRKPLSLSTQGAVGLVPYLLIESIKTGVYQFATPYKLIIAHEKDTLMVMDGASSGTVTIGAAGAIGSTLAAIRTNDPDSFSPYLLHHFLADNQREITANNIGSAIPHANKDFINGMIVPVPSPSVNANFNDFARQLRRLINNLRSKTMNLRQTRDLMLPKLISGEVDVSDLDIAGLQTE